MSHLGFGCWRLALETERKEDRCSRGSRGGLQVKYNGIGTVKSQSIAPGTPLRPEVTTIQLRLS